MIFSLALICAIIFVQAQANSLESKQANGINWDHHDRSLQEAGRNKECTADDMSKRSEPNEHCYNCRLCLQRKCLDTRNWKGSTSRQAYWCQLLLEGARNGRASDWLGCLENNGSSRTLTVSDHSVINENGGNRDTWGTCARRCDDVCYKQPVERTNTDGPICTAEQLATQSSSQDQICFPCRQCLKRQCDASWSTYSQCDSIVNGLEVGTSHDWIQCLHHDGQQRRRLNQTPELWSECAQKCNDRCHHAISYNAPDTSASPYGANWVEPLCLQGDGNESKGTLTSTLSRQYFKSFYEPLNFRVRGEMANGRSSYATKISVSGGGWNNVLVELTDRPLLHGETFELKGNKYQVGVGLCIESCDMADNKYGIRWQYNCIGFYGDNGGMMFTTKPDGKEVIVKGVAGHTAYMRQGFTYDAVNNCVTPYHSGVSRGSCHPLPTHFEGKVVRAIGQVWNSASADLVLHPPPATQ